MNYIEEADTRLLLAGFWKCDFDFIPAVGHLYVTGIPLIKILRRLVSAHKVIQSGLLNWLHFFGCACSADQATYV